MGSDSKNMSDGKESPELKDTHEESAEGTSRDHDQEDAEIKKRKTSLELERIKESFELDKKERNKDIKLKQIYAFGAGIFSVLAFIAAIGLTISLVWGVLDGYKAVEKVVKPVPKVERCNKKVGEMSFVVGADGKISVSRDKVITVVQANEKPCSYVNSLTALIASYSSSLKPFIYLNALLYFVFLFLIFSILRVNFHRGDQEQKEFKEMFSPVLEVIKDLIDYFRNGKGS